jgi:hypothetical protein
MSLHPFELWLREEHILNLTKETYNLARDAYREGIDHRNKEILEGLTNTPHGNTLSPATAQEGK